MRKAISLVSFGVLCATLVLLMQYESPQLVFAEQSTQKIHSEGEEIKVGLGGLGAVCPTAINLTSVQDLTPSIQMVTTGSSTSVAGCSFMTWYFDDSISPSARQLFPIGLNDSLTDIKIISTIDVESDTTMTSACQIFGLSESGIDPRNNITAAYEAVQGRTNLLASSFSNCIDVSTQVPQIATGSLGSWYDTISVNNTFFSYGINTISDDRFLNRRIRNSETVLVMEYINPTTSTAWQIQEHSKFPSLTITTGSGSDLGGNFNLDTGSSGGQMVVFKEFNKSEVGSNDIQVTGNFLVTGSDTNDVRLRFEIKDGGYGMQDEDSFPFQEPDIYQNGGSLGVVHLLAKTLDVIQPFDISMIPNYANSTEDIFTVFIGLDDNSTANTISANITNFEIDSQIRHDFTSLDYVKFWELTIAGAAIQTPFPALRSDFDAGIVNTTSIGTVGVTGSVLPAPNDPTNLIANLADFDTIGLAWSHDLLNSTGIRIERDEGSGFNVIAILSNVPTNTFEDANQLNRTKADKSSLEDAVGLEPNTTYTYRITILNGETESNSLTSAAFTTPPTLDYWELHEHSAERPFIDPCTSTTCVPIFNVETNGGTGDWLSLQDLQPLQFEGRESFFLMKSFNITEFGIDERTELEYYFDSDCNGFASCVTPRVSFTDGKFNRFSSELFPNVAGVHPVNGTLQRISSSPGSTTGTFTAFEPHLVRVTPNIKDFLSGFMTVYFTWDSVLTGQLDIKNITLTNSTTWDFTNTILNYTSDPTNCNLGTAGELTLLLNSATECDSGSVLAKSDSHLQTVTNYNVTSDWEFRENKDNAAFNALGLWTFTSNSTGFNIRALENTDIGFTNNQPTEQGEGYMWKTFVPVSAVSNFTVIHEAEGSAINTIQLIVMEQLLPDTLARYNGTIFESSQALVSTTISSGLTIAPPFNEVTTELMADTSAYIGIPVTAFLFVNDPSSATNSIHHIKQIELNNIKYNFSNAVVNLEVNGQDGKRGVVSASSVIIPPSPTPETVANLTAVANVADVDLSWINGVNTTDQKIERSSNGGINFTTIEESVGVPTTFTDINVPLGTSFIYKITPSNLVPPFSESVGNSTLSNSVLSNDTPTQVQNILAILNNFFTLNQIELSWTQAGNGTGNPLGVGVNLTSTKIFSRNVTGGNDFILTQELLAASPPPTEFNDTNVVVPNDYSYMLSSCNILGCGPNSTEVFADTIDFPDAIFDLLFYNLNFNSLILNWTQPFLGGGSLQNGYQINFTTPHAEPLTIILSDTGSSFTEFTVSGLTELTNYTFRVSAINQAGLNATGLKLNVTTLDDFTEENFTVGFIGEFPDSSIDEPNLDIIPIRFERIDINDTTVRLNVTYANNIDLACSFDYKFAMTESFFDSPLDTVNIGGGDQETSFLFTDFDNEVIDVFCWNEVANQTATISGSYILTQTNFPLLQQVQAFRDGDFGTEGMFGVLDMITLMVIIISMIGFNRVNETVGAIFNIIFIGALSFFGIIELSTTIFAAIALVLMLVIISTRKV